MIYSRLTVLLIIIMYIAPAWAEAGPFMPSGGISRASGYALIAFNERNARANPRSGRQPSRPGSNSGGSAPHRNLPPGYNRGFGYGFERRHAQPGSIPAPVSRRPF